MGPEIETGELCRAADITKNVLNRLRGQYVEVVPARRVGHGLLMWAPEMVETVRRIVEREKHLRTVGR